MNSEPMRSCIDDTEDPCYWRGPGHTCTRIKFVPCAHSDRIQKRREKELTEKKEGAK